MADEKGALPASSNTERAILACILKEPKQMNVVEQRIGAQDFFYEPHRIIFQAMQRLSASHQPIDYRTLEDQLVRHEQLEKVGGLEYVLSLAQDTYYVVNIPSYIEIIKEKSLLRNLALLGQQVQSDAVSEVVDGSAILQRMEDSILLFGQEQSQEGFTLVRDLLPDAMERITNLQTNRGKLTGITTGFRAVDRELSGLQKSDLILIAARPSMGKTALGVNMAYNAARYRHKGEHPYKVAIFSLEMSKQQLNQRLLAMASGVDLQKILSGSLEDSDWEQLLTGFKQLSELPIFIDDTSSISIQVLRSKCRRLKMEEGLDLIVIDYLQLMTVDDLRRSENRQQEISTISRGLKALAKEMNCPVLALSQLSRKAEAREAQRPMMSDMRESGAIEQDADVVMLLYREDYYKKETENPNITEVIIAKHRNGPTGTVQLYFQKELTKFTDLDYREE